MSTTPLESRDWLSVPDISSRLDVSEETVRRWVRTGQLRGYRAGRQFRVAEKDLTEFIRAGVDAPGPDGLSEAVARIVAAAPALTSEQRDRLAALLGPASNGRAVAS